MNQEFKPKRSKFTLLKIAASMILLLLVAAAAILPYLARPRVSNCRVNCPNNLKQLGIAFRGFGIDMGGFPMSVSVITNRPVEPIENAVNELKDATANTIMVR